MGISGLLPRILPSAGRENYDLRALSDGVITITVRRGADDDDDYGRDRDDDHDYDGEGGDGGEEEEEEPAKKKRRRSPSSTSTSASTTTWTRRRVRVGVDASGWIARAAHGHGGLLMDERHLSYRGRAELRDERARSSRQEGGVANEGDGGGDDGDGERRPTDEVERESTRRRLEYVAACTLTVLRKIEYLVDDCQTSVLLVLDGATPPCKRDVVRARSDRRADAAEERDGEEGGGEAPGGGGGATATTATTKPRGRRRKSCGAYRRRIAPAPARITLCAAKWSRPSSVRAASDAGRASWRRTRQTGSSRTSQDHAAPWTWS